MAKSTAKEMADHFPYPDPARVGDALITDRVLQAAKPLEERLRAEVKMLDAEMRSRIAHEILGPLRDVSPSIWALTVLAERLIEAKDGMQCYQAVQSFNEHTSQLLSTDEGKLELMSALRALGRLQRVPR